MAKIRRDWQMKYKKGQYALKASARTSVRMTYYKNKQRKDRQIKPLILIRSLTVE